MKIDFQNGGYGGHFGFSIATILAVVGLQVSPTLRTKFQVSLHFDSVVEIPNRLSRCGHLGFPIETILTSFDLQRTPTLPNKFRVNWSFGSKEEFKIDFQDGLRGGPLRSTIGLILLIYKSPRYFLPRFESIDKIYFQDGRHP